MLTTEQKLKLLEKFIQENHYKDGDYNQSCGFRIKCSYIEGTVLLHSSDLTKDEKDYMQGLVDQYVQTRRGFWCWTSGRSGFRFLYRFYFRFNLDELIMKLGDFKIKVNSEAESREIQRLLFKLGCGWYSGGRDLRYTDKPYIYKENKGLSYGSNKETFNTENVEEVTLEQLRKFVEQSARSTEQPNNSTEEEQQVQQENSLNENLEESLVKYEEWINTKTFEVKQIPQGVTEVTGNCWIKIPEDAEFAVAKGGEFEFRKGREYFGHNGEWLQGSWYRGDYPKSDWKIVWEREVAVEETKVGDHFIEERTKVFKKILQGVKFQYRYNDQGQWHNLTPKGFDHLLKPNVVFREKPQKVTIDGVEMGKDAAIKYIEKHY